MTDKHGYGAMICALLSRQPSAEVAAMAAHLAERKGVVAVLFYGNMLRERTASGLMDFYVLTSGARAYHGPTLSALANRVCPPNVYHESLQVPSPVQAKVAVMRLSSFAHRMRRASWDTTLWARFSQPALLVHARDASVRQQVMDAIIQAYETAAWWALRLGDAGDDADTAWQTLFRHTYGAELRVEGHGRARSIVASAPALYNQLYDDLMRDAQEIPAAERAAARHAWQRRRAIGKLINIIRLIKAAFTFQSGLAYALDKIERHSGQPVVLSPWEKRLPWLAAPFVLARLIWQRRLR